ncbi:hypothetical protein PspLS_10810 [Pyricularia sp. CBS 133598]|nr:hypothetical protein PspLS_10810 [Pyricularia sp. CBS 133598]
MSGYLPFQQDIYDAIDDEVLDEDDPFFDGSDDNETVSLDPASRTAVFERDLLCLPLDRPGSDRTAESTPIFLGHGRIDGKVPRSLGEAMAAGYKVELKIYDNLGHWYKIPDEIDDLVDFLRSSVGWALCEPPRIRRLAHREPHLKQNRPSYHMISMVFQMTNISFLHGLMIFSNALSFAHPDIQAGCRMALAYSQYSG